MLIYVCSLLSSVSPVINTSTYRIKQMTGTYDSSSETSRNIEQCLCVRPRDIRVLLCDVVKCLEFNQFIHTVSVCELKAFYYWIYELNSGKR